MENAMADEAARHADHRPRLGRGLAALIGDANDEPAAGRGAPRKALARGATRRPARDPDRRHRRQRSRGA